MEDVNELIERHGLQEDGEHVIIPYTGKDGIGKRIFLLKRRFVRIIYPDEYFLDIPLTVAIDALLQYPELPLSRSLELTHKELLAGRSRFAAHEEMEKEGNAGVDDNGGSGHITI